MIINYTGLVITIFVILLALTIFFIYMAKKENLLPQLTKSRKNSEINKHQLNLNSKNKKEEHFFKYNLYAVNSQIFSSFFSFSFLSFPSFPFPSLPFFLFLFKISSVCSGQLDTQSQGPKEESKEPRQLRQSCISTLICS